MESLLGTQNALHAGNDLTLVGTQKVEGLAGSINRISEFSPVSTGDGVLVFIKSAMPPSIISPNFPSFFSKLKVKTISS